MKKLIELLTKKIPSEKQDNTFSFILSIIKKHSITNIDKLKIYINMSIGVCQTWLDKNKNGSTINNVRRDYAKNLSHLKKAEELIDNYL